jgi:transposase
LAATVPAADVVLFADEVDIHLNPKIGPDWMLPRTQRLVVTPGNNEKRHVAGAYDPVAQRLVYVEGDRKHSGLFVNLLRALLEVYRGARRIHVILDNFIIHKSRVTRAWLAAQGTGIRLQFTPPYCPEANRIERLWLDLHANVTRNHCAHTIGELLDNVHRYLCDRFHTERRVLLAA